MVAGWRRSGQQLGVAVASAALAAVCLARVARSQVEDRTAPPIGVQVLFDGRDLSAWERRGSQAPAAWMIQDGAMTAGGGDIETRERFEDFQLHLEFAVPYMPNARGQGRGNSGVFLQGRYEIQILNWYGKTEPGTGDCGAVYSQSAPLLNACKPALRWQSYDITFRAPRFEDGKLTEQPRVTVLQNGQIIQNNTEIRGSTAGPVPIEQTAQPGPIILQDHGNPVRFRNIWITPLPLHGASKDQ